MNTSNESVKVHMSSILVWTPHFLSSYNITKKADAASMWPMPTRVNGSIVAEVEMLELVCTTREGLISFLPLANTVDLRHCFVKSHKTISFLTIV